MQQTVTLIVALPQAFCLGPWSSWAAPHALARASNAMWCLGQVMPQLPTLGKSISVANSSNVTQRLKSSQAFVNLPARTSGARYQSPSIHKKNALCIPYSLIKSPLYTSLAIFTAYSLLSSMDLTILSLRENKWKSRMLQKYPHQSTLHQPLPLLRRPAGNMTEPFWCRTLNYVKAFLSLYDCQRYCWTKRPVPSRDYCAEKS